MQPEQLLKAIKGIAVGIGLDPRAEVELAGGPPQVSPIPDGLHPALHQILSNLHGKGLYSHQAKALEAFLQGQDICLATPTASGKSLIFMAAGAHAALQTRDVKILALYPVKALIQDQLAKWNSLLRPLGHAAAFIDGSVPVASRAAILEQNTVILMTPDVVHAWLLSNLEHVNIRRFMACLNVLILDEAHVYEGVFGTNMAYLLHRLQAVSSIKQIIASTATIGDPGAFLEKLTGRDMVIFDYDSDGTGSPGRTMLLLRPAGRGAFEQHVSLLRAILKQNLGRFLAFADSRKMVEQIVSVLSRTETAPALDAGPDHGDEDEPDTDLADKAKVLPYRAGYEEEDRLRIQRAMDSGELQGIVSTSARWKRVVPWLMNSGPSATRWWK